VYEISLKLAILNTMYGTGPISAECGHHCMYDPLHVAGDDAIGFLWYERGGCWNVHVGRTSPQCHEINVAEWMWAYSKTDNFCCISDPLSGPSEEPMSGVLDRACSTDDDCYQFQGLDSWNEEFVSSLCTDDTTDKSVSATLCDAYAGNRDYENSLKLAILNTMYGTGTISSECGHHCMYDPLHIAGDDAIGFLWYERGGCWNVYVGKTNPQCHEINVHEWMWAYTKADNWCCTSNPSEGPMASVLN